MSAATIRILQAAADISGGVDPLAERLAISAPMLRKYMSGAFPLPDPLLLLAVDIVLADRESRMPPALPSGFNLSGSSLSGEG